MWNEPHPLYGWNLERNEIKGEDMADLIDRQAVIDLLKKSTSRDIEEVVITEKHINLIKDMPCAYDVEKVVAELEKIPIYEFGVTLLNTEEYVKLSDLKQAIDIVKAGGING